MRGRIGWEVRALTLIPIDEISALESTNFNFVIYRNLRL